MRSDRLIDWSKSLFDVFLSKSDLLEIVEDMCFSSTVGSNQKVAFLGQKSKQQIVLKWHSKFKSNE